MASVAELERPVPALRVHGADIHATIAELARAAGMQIAVDPAVAQVYNHQKITLDLTDVTLGDVVKAIPPPDGDSEYRMVLARQDGGLVLHSLADLGAAMSIRVYDIGHFLPTTPPPPPQPADVANLCFYDPTAYTPEKALREDRLWAAQGIAEGSGHLILQHTQMDPNLIQSYKGPGGFSTELCVSFDNHLIVVAPELAQPIVSEFLRTLNEQPR